MNGYKLERFGGLLKEESLTCIENQLLLRDSCVLESVSPFAGYYNEQTGDKPLYLYLMLEGNATYWPVTLAIQAVQSQSPFSFDAVFGEIQFTDGSHCYTIRVRDLPQYDLISDLQRMLIAQGLMFRKRNRSIVSLPALIRLEKFFYLDETPEGYFIDKQQAHHGYFELPKSMEWSKFQKLTTEVKYDVNLLYFDAAQAYFMDQEKIKHLVRIYKEGLTNSHLQKISARYRTLFERFD